MAVLLLTVFGIYLRFGKSNKQVMLLDTLEVLFCDHINVANYRTLLPLQLLHRPRKRMHHRPMMKKETSLLLTKMQARETKIHQQQQQHRQRVIAIRQTAPSLPVPRRTKSLI